MIEPGLPSAFARKGTVLSKLPESQVRPLEDWQLWYKENPWCNDHQHILDEDILAYMMKNHQHKTSLNPI